MIWVGILVGIILGIISGSFSGFMTCVILGGIGSYAFRKLQSASYITHENSFQADPTLTQSQLERKIERLEAQMHDMAKRLSKLEQCPTPQPDTVTTLPPEHPAHEAPPTPLPINIKPLQSITPQSSPVESTVPRPIAQVARPITRLADIPSSSENRSTPTSAPRDDISHTTHHHTSETIRPAKQPSFTTIEPSAPSWLENVWQNWIIGGNPLLKMGVLILFLGLTFLLRYAAEHAVLPIEYRYTGVAITGIALLVFGWKWRERQDNYGLILQGSGIGVLYLTTLAAMKLHPLIPHGFGFVVLLSITGYAALLAILQNALALAIASSLGGFAAPILVSQGGEHHVAFFTYLTVLNLGIVAMAWFKAWRVLNVLGFICTFLLGSAWAATHYQPNLFSTTEPFILLFFVFYTIITFLFARHTLENAKNLRHALTQVDYVDGFLAFGVPIASFGWQYLLVKSSEYGAAFSALGFGFIYIVLASLLFQQTNKRYALLTETLIALGVIFGSLAIPLGLEHTWTSAAWAIEAAGMYWLGVRQTRVPARLFALVLFAGSALYFILGLHVGGEHSVLAGSWLGCLLLALSAGSIFWQSRQLTTALHPFEENMQPHTLRACALFTGILPFLVCQMHWAAPILALLGSLTVYASLHFSAPLLLRWGIAYQGIAGLLFLNTLQHSGTHATLAHGWSGLLGVCLMGVSFLGSVYSWVSQYHRDQEDRWSSSATLGLLAGLAFMNLAPLFVLPLQSSLMIWSLMGIVILWWSIRALHFGVLLFAFALEALSGFSYFITRSAYHSTFPSELSSLTPFLHNGFLAPLLISLAAFACARLLQRAQQTDNMKPIVWTSIIWAGSWWTLAWGSEISRVITHGTTQTASLIGITLFSAGLWSYLAKRWAWSQLGAATLAYLPVLILIELNSSVSHPFMGSGILVWSAALAMHGALLKWQKEWVDASLQKFPHILGVWFFVLLLATECRWHFAQWGDSDSAWSLLGWVIAPTAYLYAVTRPALQKNWPLNEHSDAYLNLAAIPMVIYVLAWTWISNWISDGTASPLPYLPLVNPLEMAHGAAILGMLLWYSSTHNGNQRELSSATIGLIGSTLFMLMTGMVMRTCHHWGNIPWHTSALLSSTLVQTSLSIVWGSLAIGLMVSVNFHKQRWVWITGAALMAIVIIKLFFVELAAHGSLGRIVSFIVVGMLLLLVGYFAPLPPKEHD